MALKIAPIRETYKGFYGKDTEEMPLIKADGRIPMNTSQLMQRRLELVNGPAGPRDFYTSTPLSTGDAIAYHPSGRVKIILNSKSIMDMTPEAPRIGGDLLIIEDVYPSLEAQEFRIKDLGKINERLSRDEAKNSLVWKILSRDQSLLEEYVDYVFSTVEKRFGYQSAMGVYLDSPSARPKIREWTIFGLGSRSGIYGRIVFGYDRFIGISAENSGKP